MKKPGWLKKAVATANGYFTTAGKKLKGVSLSQEFVDQWNGTVEAIEDKIEDIVGVTSTVDANDSMEELEALEAPKPKPKKKRKKKSVAATFGLKD